MTTNSNPRAEPFFQRFRLTAAQQAAIDKAELALPEGKRSAFRHGVHRTLRASRAHGDVSDYLVKVAVTSQQRVSR
jgi:hypothetical protein